MLIGFDASRAFVREQTGTENYSLNLLRALAKVDRKNRYEVYLRSSKLEVRSSKFKWPKNFEFVLVRPNRVWTQLGLALETWKNPVDVLFVPAHTLPVLRNPKTRTVVTIHDLGVEYLANYHKFPQRYYLDLASKYAARHADAIIAPSAATKADLVHRYGLNGKKVQIIAEGVDLKVFKRRSTKEIDRVRKRYKLPQNYILFVGTIQPRKNLKMVIEAFSKAYNRIQKVYKIKTANWPVKISKSKSGNSLQKDTFDCQFVLAGRLGWDYREILEAPKKLGVERRVKFLKYVAAADLPALYSGARLFVFPSLLEGFGLPVLEAVACGTKVLASDIGTNREIKSRLGKIGEAVTLLKPNVKGKWSQFLYQDISQYSKSNINISDEAKLKEISGVLGTKFSWDEAARLTVSVFEKCG